MCLYSMIHMRGQAFLQTKYLLQELKNQKNVNILSCLPGKQLLPPTGKVHLTCYYCYYCVVDSDIHCHCSAQQLPSSKRTAFCRPIEKMSPRRRSGTGLLCPVAAIASVLWFQVPPPPQIPQTNTPTNDAICDIGLNIKEKVKNRNIFKTKHGATHLENLWKLSSNEIIQCVPSGFLITGQLKKHLAFLFWVIFGNYLHKL